jgi:DNA-binding GntR family transcriptional regulator
MDLHFLKQVTEIRLGIEGIAGELAAERISEDQVGALQHILAEVTSLETEEKSNFEKLMKYESAFHDIIYTATGNPQLEKLLHNYQSVGARFWHYLVFSREQMADQFKSHREMFAALKKGDKSLCKDIAEQHIRQYMGIIDDRIEELRSHEA